MTSCLGHVADGAESANRIHCQRRPHQYTLVSFKRATGSDVEGTQAVQLPGATNLNVEKFVK